ncbi:SMI1/KNR4 family protein [Streptomyces sp. LN245]|uniref:SMI1/KNR4 family protein n=1 Tax=Streptomyces sp. LN245 TaxID=3112975 RepID=UPI00370F8D56
MTDHLAAVTAMLGPARNRYADPSAWDRLHAELGIQLPADYRFLVDAFAPAQINGHLYLHHPATERWNLGRQIQGQIRAWSEVPWDDLDLDADEDPRRVTAHSPLGADTPCLAYCSPLPHGAEDFENLRIRTGTLADAKVLYDHPEEDHWSPSNLWSRDRSWIVCTDYDLWATKVAGPVQLVEALLDDTEIEAVRLPWAT